MTKRQAKTREMSEGYPLIRDIADSSGVVVANLELLKLRSQHDITNESKGETPRENMATIRFGL
jgi:hypothetical protein